MEILYLLVFVSLGFVVGALALFGWTIRQRTHEHADRLCLLPLEPEPTNDR